MLQSVCVCVCVCICILHFHCLLKPTSVCMCLQICRNCSGSAERKVPCASLDCPVLYKLSRVNRHLSKAPYLRQLLEQFWTAPGAARCHPGAKRCLAQLSVSVGFLLACRRFDWTLLCFHSVLLSFVCLTNIPACPDWLCGPPLGGGGLPWGGFIKGWCFCSHSLPSSLAAIGCEWSWCLQMIYVEVVLSVSSAITCSLIEY